MDDFRLHPKWRALVSDFQYLSDRYKADGDEDVLQEMLAVESLLEAFDPNMKVVTDDAREPREAARTEPAPAPPSNEEESVRGGSEGGTKRRVGPLRRLDARRAARSEVPQG